MPESSAQQSSNMRQWSFWVDRGGTFTDIVAQSPQGELLSHKLLSENPEQYEDAALAGIRDLLGLKEDAAIPAELIREVKMGTTVGTNALLERKGERVLLVTSKGFRDGLRIAYQNRPQLFDLHIVLPEMLYSQVLEVDERVTAQGEVLTQLDPLVVKDGLLDAYAQGIRSIAILFMHGYRYPAHEKQVAELAQEVGFSQVSVSHQVSPLIKYVSRGDTTVVDAYLSQVLRRYVDRVAGELGQTRLMFMKSDGGLTDARYFAGKDCILSGPAGGVVGAVKTSELAGFDKMIGFDMGGTSTDVSHFNGEFERAFETEVAGVRMRSPMMHIHTVAAGGGSILHFDGSRFRVGPDSAGADPGPAAYRKKGPLTVTDCNVMCGKIMPEHFPKIFGPDADQTLDSDEVQTRFLSLALEIKAATGEEKTPEEVADGFLAIAVDNMANAIKKISIQRGHDVSEYTLTCFGGAGGQHACLVADALGVKRVLLHPYSGVLSAFGMGLADLTDMAEQSVQEELNDSLMAHLQQEAERLGRKVREGVESQGVVPERITISTKAQLRYHGSDTCLLVDYGSRAKMEASFAAEHSKRFGFIDPAKKLNVEALVVEAQGKSDVLLTQNASPSLIEEIASEALLSVSRFFSEGDWQVAPVVDRQKMQPGNTLRGPAIIIEPHATVVVELGWQAELTGQNDLLLTRISEKKRQQAVGTSVDPVMLEIFNNLYMSIAEQMGTVLANTAHSVNIKERLDFSCAIFDGSGNLVANAPHVPVHLGSMGESVKSLIAAHGAKMLPGDVYLANAPYNGGTHLPDVTVITPVFEGGEVLFYVASRGHHADIGGLTPGSMPPDSTSVEEEGILFDNVKLVDQGRLLDQEIRTILAGGSFPARNIEQNMADLAAQIAANEKGVQELKRMIDSFGLAAVSAYMQHVQDNAEESVRRVIDHLHDGAFTFEMDNGAMIRVKVTVDHMERSATIDFSGTSEQLSSNYNAPLAVCKAAVLYVFRCLVGDNIPLNAGCMKPLQVIVPEGSLLNPQYPAAVVAGNVETSQAVTDALFGALGVLAASQGTMNNLTFGDATYQYYETIAGGSGAGKDFAGASAVQCHMTNSRLTDPEVLEHRFPVLLEEFSLRKESGGAGAFHGGDGVERRIRFLAPMSASILSNNRRHSPQGMAGGKAGKPGCNQVLRTDGSLEELSFADHADMAVGDVLIIKTPGGGGFGPAD